MRAFSLIFIVGVATVAMGMPSADEVVPETELFSANVDASSFEAARQMVKSMTAAGKTDKDCRDLAKADKEEISKTVETQQKLLDALPDGSKCVSDHDDAVGKAQKLKDQADKDAKDAATKATKMCDVKVDFGKIHLDDLSPGKCEVFYDKSVYTKAAKACADAKKAKEDADGAKEEAEKSLKKTKEEATEARDKCLCKVQHEHKKGWKDATLSDDDNEKAWTKAHHVECVLDDTPADKCKVDLCPKAKKPSMVDAAASAECKIDGIAMIVNGESNKMHYSSSYWTDDKVGDLGEGNSKTELFFQKAKEATFEFKTGSTVKKITVKLGGKSLQEMFKGGKDTTDISTSTWRDLGGSKKFGYQKYCNAQGFNMRVKKYEVRFGIIMNQENDCKSPDSAIGVGISGGGSMTAGGNCKCCQNGGTCRNQDSTVTISIKGEY